MRCSSWLMAALVGLSCAPDPRPEVADLRVMALDESDGPVAGVGVNADGREVGFTGNDGLLVVRVPGPEGRVVRAGVACPEGWRPEGESERELVVRFMKRLGSRGGELAPLEVEFRCTNRTRRSLLLVRTDGRPGLPVMILDREVARTDGDGVAQVVVEGEEGEEIDVTLDTTDALRLRPAMPSRRLVVPRVSQILVFDQQFEESAERTKRSARARRKRLGPKRI